MPSISSPTHSINPWWVTIVCGMASFIDACALIGSGYALVNYQHSIGTTPEQIGILSGVLILCIAFGALVGGRLGDKYGRRPVFIFTMAMIVIGSAMLSFMSSFSGLLMGMILVGLGAGADLPVSAAYSARAPPRHCRKAEDTGRGKRGHQIYEPGDPAPIRIARAPADPS